MKTILFILFSSFAVGFADTPTSFPVFLKEGFSCILEFEETPTQVVLGDQNLFQIEKLNKSIVIKPLVAYATTNMFVYFKSQDTRMFILAASEEAEPTYFKKFSTVIEKPQDNQKPKVQLKYVRGAKLKSAIFDKKKDYLTVDFELSADSSGRVLPNWDLIRLKYKEKFINPSKLWSERKEVQQDSMAKARLIFTKPNVPIDLKNVSIVIPLRGSKNSMNLSLEKR